MKHTKKITILHSNDLHGDFLAEQVDEKLVGGVSMLSGYIEKVRAEEPNTIHHKADRPDDSERWPNSTSGVSVKITG